MPPHQQHAEPMAVVPATVKTDRGIAMVRWLFGRFGWRVCYDGTPPGCGIIVAYPHTSNWDFVISIVAKWSIGLPVAFLGKESLFRTPLLGRFLYWCGGIPVQRGNASGGVQVMAERIREAGEKGTRWWLAIAPEGTRKASDGWRAGFYHIAHAARVPIGLAYLNYERKEIGVTTFLMPSGDMEADLQQIARWYVDHTAGKHPELVAPIRFKSSP